MYRAKTNEWDLGQPDNYEKVCAYIENKKKKILQVKKSYKEIKEVFKKYIDVTKNYANQLASIALELFPNSKSIEGELIQAIQGIILFNSETLNTLADQIAEILKNLNFKASKDLKSPILEEFSRMYQTKYSKIVNLFCNYIDGYESYEKYLIHKELGILNEKRKNENENENEIQIYDNHENIFQLKKEYIDMINETNLIVQKLVEFGYNEEKNIKVDFSNYSKTFIDKLLDCTINQKKQYEDQCLIINNLKEKINLEKIENYFLVSQQYSLHSLSIYMNNKNHRKKDSIELKQKGEFDNEIYKQLTIDNSGNIIKEMQKNGIEVKKEDLDNYE